MRFLLAPLLALAFTSCLSLANPVPNDDDSFQALVRDADDTALHAALHAKKEYKHGIFPHDRHALEAVHRVHAEEALQIVRSALIRRQDNSTTTTTTAIATTTHTTATSTKITTERTTANTDTDTTTTTNEGTTRTSTTTTTMTQGSSTSETSITTFTTVRTTTFTNDLGQPSTVTQTDIVIITPTPTEGSQTSKTTTGTPGLQTPGSDAGRVEFCGWVKIGVVVMAGVGGMVF